jgi:alpha-D-ribose 1-methylphosphonate 5-triphosphate synthase subunit PhnH
MVLNIVDHTGHTVVEDPVKIRETVTKALAEDLFRLVTARYPDGETKMVLDVGEIETAEEVTLVGPFAGG